MKLSMVMTGYETSLIPYESGQPVLGSFPSVSSHQDSHIKGMEAPLPMETTPVGCCPGEVASYHDDDV